MAARSVTRCAWAALVSALILAGCGNSHESQGSPQSQNDSQSGVKLTLEIPGGTGVVAVKFDYVRVSCSGEQVDAITVSNTVPVQDSLIAGNFDTGSQHYFAEDVAALAVGCYDTYATPLADGNVRSSQCAQARQTGVKVDEGQTTEVTLVIQCSAQGRGGIDAVAVFNRPPSIESLTFPQSKFGVPGQPVNVCVTVKDPDLDPVEIEWAAAAPGGPTFRGPTLISNETKPDGSLVQCVAIVPLEEARYAFVVTAFDQTRNSDGSLIRVEQWLAEHGNAMPSRATLAFTLISGSPLVRKLTVAFYEMGALTTCFIGDPCTGPDCVGLRDDAGELKVAFTPESMRAVPVSDPAVGASRQSECMELILVDRETVAAAEAEFQARVAEWSHGSIQLDVVRRFVPTVYMGETRWGAGFWIAPWDLPAQATVIPPLDFVPDFNVIVAPIRDPASGLHHDIAACGGTFGADLGTGGAGWSWIPITSRSCSFECASGENIVSAWLNQVYWAYHNLSGFQDIYNGSYPPCGQGDPNPKKWFPAPDQCNVDPDFERCGSGDCGGAALVDSHILGSHWDPNVAFVASTCKDGVQDFGETGVDQGGPCVLVNGRSQSTPVPNPPPDPSFVTPAPGQCR